MKSRPKDNRGSSRPAAFRETRVASPDHSGRIDPLERDAAELRAALSELVRLYQFRDRNGICCEDVSVTQCYTLGAIARLGSPTLSELADEMYLDKSTTSRVVDSLVRKGYAQRVADAADRRAVRIRPTESGNGLIEKIERRLIEGEKDLIADFDPKVRQATTRLVARLARAARERFSRQGLSCRPRRGREPGRGGERS